MNESEKNPLLRRIFEDAAGALPSPRESDVPHLIENDDLLTRWSLDQLSQAEHDQVVRHLSLCGSCRGELASLVKAGVLEPPASRDADRQVHVVPASPDTTPPLSQPMVTGGLRRRVAWGVAILTAAAAAVLAIVLWYPRFHYDSELARARVELEKGDPKAAQDRLARLLDAESADSARRQRATDLFEKACVAQAETELATGNFGDVAAIDKTAAARGIKSGRLENLKIQADRRMTVQVALAEKSSLLDYEYRLDGTSGKEIKVPDDKTKRIMQELKEAVDKHPNNMDLLLNRGQLLLEFGPPQEAYKVFMDAHDLEPHNTLALIGMGLANYSMSEYKSALDHFDAALRLDPKSALANLNKAICLEGLNRSDEARPYFEAARDATTDKNLKERIDRWLNKKP
jgi:tetratricopeptide (TPR) repeat protein